VYDFVGLLDESKQHISFADCGVADYNYFCEIVVFFLLEGMFSLSLEHSYEFRKFIAWL
jgi:hypothetical protein